MNAPETMSIDTPLIREGEEVRAQVRYTREQITQFAVLTGDLNPLHHDRQAAERASFGEIIASGQQTSSQLMGLAASHFSRHDDGVPREMLALNFNFSFKAPVFADQVLNLAWRVARVEPNPRRGGFIGHIEGSASVAGRPHVIGRGTILVRRAAGRNV